MLKWVKGFVAAAIIGTGFLVTSAPTVAHADDYWDGYWNWYDNSYRPYYSRRYYGGYGYYGSPYYRGGAYYGTPNLGYRDYPGGGGAVRVGPLRFGWR